MGNETPISNKVFNSFVCLKYSFPTNYVWTYVIKECAKDDNEAILILKDTILEFVELKKTMNEEELIQFVIENAESKEGEAEKEFRKFDNALLFGDKEAIQSLSMECEGAEILWSGFYPKDVALKLREISLNEPIKRIPISEDGNKVKIIASGWPFAIEMELINGKWRIDANDIIAMWRSNHASLKS